MFFVTATYDKQTFLLKTKRDESPSYGTCSRSTKTRQFGKEARKGIGRNVQTTRLPGGTTLKRAVQILEMPLPNRPTSKKNLNNLSDYETITAFRDGSFAIHFSINRRQCFNGSPSLEVTRSTPLRFRIDKRLVYSIRKRPYLTYE